jgi:hypothetical protein
LAYLKIAAVGAGLPDDYPLMIFFYLQGSKLLWFGFVGDPGEIKQGTGACKNLINPNKNNKTLFCRGNRSSAVPVQVFIMNL